MRRHPRALSFRIERPRSRPNQLNIFSSTWHQKVISQDGEPKRQQNGQHHPPQRRRSKSRFAHQRNKTERQMPPAALSFSAPCAGFCGSSPTCAVAYWIDSVGWCPSVGEIIRQRNLSTIFYILYCRGQAFSDEWGPFCRGRTRYPKWIEHYRNNEMSCSASADGISIDQVRFAVSVLCTVTIDRIAPYPLWTLSSGGTLGRQRVTRVVS